MPAKTTPATTWYRLPPPPPSPRLTHTSRTNPNTSSNPPASPHLTRASKSSTVSPSSNPPASPHLPRASKSSTVNLPTSPLAAKNPPSSTTTTTSTTSKTSASLHSSKASFHSNSSKATSVNPNPSKPAPTNPHLPSRPAPVNPPSSKSSAGNPPPSKPTTANPPPSKSTVANSSTSKPTVANPSLSKPTSANSSTSKPTSSNPPPSRPTSLNPPPSPRLSRRLASPTQNAPKHLPQMPGALASPGARTPAFPNTISPTKLPSSMPDQTSSSPKRSSGASKIASPTRLRSTDRLPPVTKTPTSPVVDQGLKLISEDTKPKLKDGKASRTSENKNKPEDRKKDKASSEKVRRSEVTKKQAEVRVEPKIIPKRKKSERSNSDTDIKPKKMVIKERQPSPSRLEEEIIPPAQLPKTGPTDRGLKLGKVLRRPTTLKLPTHSRPLLSCKELLVKNVEERMREMDIGKEGEGGCVDKITGNVEEIMREMDLGKEADDCQGKVDGSDENEAEMVTPVADMDVVDSEKVGLFPSLHLPTINTAKANNNEPDSEECDDLTADDLEPLSSDMGTYSLDLIPDSSLEIISDSDVRGTHRYTSYACMPGFGSTEMVSSDVFESQVATEAYPDDGKMQEDGGTCVIRRESDQIVTKACSDDGKMQSDGLCIIEGDSDNQVMLHIGESHCLRDEMPEDFDNHGTNSSSVHYPGDNKILNRCNQGDSSSSQDCHNHDHNDCLDYYNHGSKTSSEYHGGLSSTDLLMFVESFEKTNQSSPQDDSTMQDITSIARDEEEDGNKDEPLTIDEEISIDDEKATPKDERSTRNSDRNLYNGDRNPQSGGRTLQDGDRNLQKDDQNLQNDDRDPQIDDQNPQIGDRKPQNGDRSQQSRDLKLRNNLKTSTDVGGKLAKDEHPSFPSEMTKDQMEGLKNADNWIQHSTSGPKSPAARKVQESRRKARCGEIKRDVAPPPRAKVSENVRLREANNITARATEAKKAKKKIKDEEMTRVSERRSKRKIETERTRGGMKKSARLFVEKGSTASGGGGSRGSRDSRVTPSRQNATTVEKKRVEAPPPRRPRLDNIKSTIPKPGRLPPRNNTDPVKAARAGGGSGPRGPLVGHNGPAQQQQQQQAGEEQVRRLEAQVEARAAEARAATKQREEAARGIQALTVLIHHLTTTYDPFSTPRLKAEVVRLSTQLTEARLNLDESSAALRRAEEASASREEQHQEEIKKLQEQHQEALDLLTQQHKQQIDLALEKHRKELSKFAEDQQAQREDVSRAHAAEMEQLEGEWHNKLDIQHEKHLCALQDLNTQHTHKLRELELSRQARERELEEANCRLQQDQEALRVESRKLQETLLNDTDHRLLAVRKMCNSLKSEVDSLKTVVDMKNTEIHELRGRVVETERLGGELEAARERVRALQAKTEDLQAQMEKRVQQERHLVNEHRQLLETYQRESTANKRLSLENEELAWKLRQREEIMSTSMPSSTLDLVSRAGPPRHQEGAASPQAAPRSPRVAVRSPSGKISPSKCEAKRRSRLGLSPEANVEGHERLEEVSFESPPPSPCVKAVVEKSNSVSFILDLNDSQSDDSFLDLPPSPRPRPQRTASLSAADRPRTPTHIRRVIHNNRANSLNRNCVLGDAKPKDTSRKPKEINGKGKESHEKPKEFNGKSLEVNGRPGSRRTTSESSDAGSEVERISPTGMAWTVPVHQPKSPVKMGPHNGSPVRKRIEHHLLEDPDEDEYEETPSGTHQFIEVGGLTSSSEAASDSELSQCDIKEGSLTDSDSDSCDSERHTQKGNLGHKSGPWCPKEGAGEAMITDELLKQYASEQISVDGLPMAKRNGRRRLPSAPSSDSDGNVTPHNEGNNDVSWSEDVDITSSSEIHELC